MNAILQPIIPLFGIIWLGYFLRRSGFLAIDFWPCLDKLVYYILMPCLMFNSMQYVSFENIDIFGRLAALVVLHMVIIAAVLLVLNKWKYLPVAHDNFSAFLQGCVRFNNYIATPVIFAVYSYEGLAIYGIILSIAAPLSNAIAILGMLRYGSQGYFGLSNFCISIIKNPIILGVFLGLVIGGLGIPLFYLGDMISLIAQSAFAISLLSIGAGMRIRSVAVEYRQLAFGVAAIKLLISPVLMMVICWLLAVPSKEMAIAIIYTSMPAAASSYILAKQLGANASLTIAIIVITILASMVVLPLVLLLVQDMWI